MAGLTLAITGLIKLGKAATQAASDLEEIQNVVNVVFGQSAGEIDAWAKSALKNFGLVESEAKDIASTFKAMANGMGVADRSGKAMSLRLTELAGDLASFRNTTTEQAKTALSGVFTGETEALKKYGIVMTETNLKAYALSQGITKAYSAMSQAEKVALRYNYVLSVTADAQGDFARSSNSWANQIRILKGQWSSFLGVLGTAITQVLAPLVQALNKVLEVLITITKTAFAAMGIDFSVTSAKVSSGLADAADSAGDITDGIGDATTAAKELYHELAPFDELNLLGDKDKGGSGGGLGDLGSGGLDIEEPEIKLEKTQDSAIKSLDELLDDLNAWFENTMGPWLKDKAGWLADKINEIVENTPWDKLGYTAANGLNQIIYALDEFFTRLKGYDIGEGFGTLINSFVEKFDAVAFGKMIGDKIKLGLDIAIGFLDTFDAKRFGEKLADIFNNLDLVGIAERLGQTLTGIIDSALNIAIGFFGNADGKQFGEAVAKFFNNLDIPKLAEDLGLTLNKVINFAIDGLIGFIENFNPKSLVEAWDKFWSNLDVGEIKLKFTELFDTIADKIDETFGEGSTEKIKKFAETLALIGAAAATVNLTIFLNDLGLIPFAVMEGEKGLKGLIKNIQSTYGWIIGGSGMGDDKMEWFLAPIKSASEWISTTAAPAISNAILAIGQVFAHPIQSIQAFGSTLGTVLGNAGTAIADFVTSIPTLLSQVPGAISGALGSLGTFFSGLGSSIATAVTSAVAYIGENGILGTALNGLKALVGVLQGGIESLFAVLAANPIAVVIAAIVALVASFVYLWNTCDTFRQFFIDIWENSIKPIFDQVAEVWRNLLEKHIIPLWENSLKPCIEAIWEVVKTVWDAIAHVLGTVIMVLTPIVTGVIGILGGLLASIGEIFGDIMDIIGGILDFITGVFTGDWKKAWEGVVKIFKGLWDGIVDIFKMPINAVIGLINGFMGAIVSGVNAIIKKLNSFSFSVPDWVPGIGGKKIGFNFSLWTAPSIPLLANGGVITDPTIAMLGEYAGAKEDPEIAAPQSILRETMVSANGDMVSAMYQMCQQLIKAIEGIDMNVSIGDDTIAASAKRGSDAYRRRTGKPMFATT